MADSGLRDRACYCLPSVLLLLRLALPAAALFAAIAPLEAAAPAPTGARAAPPPGAASAPRAGRTSKAPAAARTAVEALLRSSPRAPSAADLAATGRDADAVLIAIARDDKAELPLRARAVSALVAAPTAAARRFLGGLIVDKADATGEADRVLLRRAAVALGWVGGPDALHHLSALLDSEEPEVRIDAAIGLGLLRLPAAAELLRQRLHEEKVDKVRVHLAGQLRAIESALAPAP